MKTRLIQVTRRLTLTSTHVLEVPSSLGNFEIESALLDEANLFDQLDCLSDRFDMKEEAQEFDIEPAAKEAKADLGLGNQFYKQALIDDELIPAEG